MEGLIQLKSVKSTSKQEDLGLTLASPAIQPATRIIQNADDVLHLLQSKPDHESLEDCLSWLKSHVNLLDVRIPGPKAAQVAKVLARDVLPDYWRSLSQGDSETKNLKHKLIWCFQTVVGIGALVMRIRELSEQASIEASKETIKDTIDALESALRGSHVVRTIAGNVLQLTHNPVNSQITWDTFVPYLAGGKVINAVAAAQLRLRRDTDTTSDSWTGDAAAYTRWLGRNLRSFVNDEGPYQEQLTRSKGKLFTKAWFLGYRQELVRETFRGSFSGDPIILEKDISFLQSLKPTEVQGILFTILQVISADNAGKPENLVVGGLSALLKHMVEQIETVPKSLVWWLINDPERRALVDIKVRRAIITALDGVPGSLEDACQLLLRRLGDKLYIQNQPMLQQEVHTQDLLLLIGHLHHRNPNYIKQLAKTGDYLNAVSHRLGASVARASSLGMVVGTAVSTLVDAPDKRLNFEDERMSLEEVEWYKKLTTINDEAGTLDDLKACAEYRLKPKTKSESVVSKALPSSNPSKGPMIQDASPSASSDESSDEDLPYYAKPDSDPSDSEDDPTLINRARPKAPVYIRDLLRALRDEENFDRHNLALASAADLIRRKANFGTEVSDHTEDLAAQLTSLRDTFNIEDFEEQRLRAMIALVVGRPVEMGKWFATAAFSGDYSISQRASMLTALSMGARELAGFQKEDAHLTKAYTAIEDTFPSRKRLPPQLESIYGQGVPAPLSDRATSIAARPVSAAAAQMQSTLLKPLATSAASTLAGPIAVQLQASSVRTKSKSARVPVKRVDNKLARLLADSFFHPLASRFRLELAHSTRTPFATVPSLLAHFLKTLALLLTAAGTNTLSLPGILAEMLSLLQWPPVRAAAATHAPVREAVLLGLLATVDVATGGDGGVDGGEGHARRTVTEAELVREHGTELLEAQAWCETVFEATPAGKSRDESETTIRQLAAGVLVKIGEIVQRYQQEMMGDLARFG